MNRPGTNVIEVLRNARSVAIVGASEDGAKASGRTQRYLRRYGFTGPIYPINPTRDTVQAEPAYRSLLDLPEAPEVAVIVVAAHLVEQAVIDAGAIGVKVAIIFASGYAEVPDGVERQTSLKQVAAEAGVRVIGPNCVGAVVAPSLTTAFMSGLDQDRFDLADDGVAFVSQSGAMGAFILNLAQSDGLGVGTFVSTGNEMDVTMSELIASLAQTPGTRAILGYVEGIRDGAVFTQALATAQANDIPVCLMKVGRSDRGAQAAASHTGSLAGSDRVYQGVFDRYGVHRAESVQELLDLGRIFSIDRRAAGPRVSIVTLSGGAGALMTDEADRLGLDIFVWGEPWQQRMAAGLPDFASTTNPIDATGIISINDEALRHTIDVALANPETDVAVLVLGNLDGEERRICDVITACAAHSDKPLVVTWVGGSGLAPRILNAAQIPTFDDPRRAMQAVAALSRRGLGRQNPARTADEPAAPQAPDLPDTFDEVSAKQLLAAAGVPAVPERAVQSVDEAVTVADELGYPVVVKLLSAQVQHKSELGVVRLSLADQSAVREAANDIVRIATEHQIEDRRLVVAAMIPAGPELILGSSIDPVFGPVTVVGIGGIYTEILDDAVTRPSPVTHDEATAMVDSLKAVALLRGARNGVVVDENALADAIVGFSALSAVLGTSVESIEVNPLAFLPDRSPVAADALIIPTNENDLS